MLTTANANDNDHLFETKVDFIILMNVIFFLLLTKMAVNVSLFQIIVHPLCYFVIINILLNLYFETIIFGHVINSTLAYFKFKNDELSKTTPHLVSFFESCNTLSNHFPFLSFLHFFLYLSASLEIHFKSIAPYFTLSLSFSHSYTDITLPRRSFLFLSHSQKYKIFLSFFLSLSMQTVIFFSPDITILVCHHFNL